MHRRVRLTVALAGALAVLVAGCGSTTQDRRAEAQAAVDRTRPGEATVIEVRPGGITAGPLVVAALSDDDVAGAVWPIDDSEGCGPDTRCEEEMLRALDTARGDADDLRAALGAFADCGRPVLGVDHVQRIGADTLGEAVAGEPIARTEIAVLVAAAVDGPARDTLPAELDACVTAYAAERATRPDVVPDGGVLVHVLVVDPGPTPPAAVPGRPYRFVLADAADTLSEQVRHRTVVRIDGDRLVLPAGALLGPADTGLLDEPALAAARSWFTEQGLRDPGGTLSTRDAAYLPGRTDRVRVLVEDLAMGGDEQVVVVEIDTDGSDAVAVERIVAPERLDQPGP